MLKICKKEGKIQMFRKYQSKLEEGVLYIFCSMISWVKHYRVEFSITTSVLQMRKPDLGGFCLPLIP